MTPLHLTPNHINNLILGAKLTESDLTVNSGNFLNLGVYTGGSPYLLSVGSPEGRSGYNLSPSTFEVIDDYTLNTYVLINSNTLALAPHLLSLPASY